MRINRLPEGQTLPKSWFAHIWSVQPLFYTSDGDEERKRKKDSKTPLRRRKGMLEGRGGFCSGAPSKTP